MSPLPHHLLPDTATVLADGSLSVEDDGQGFDPEHHAAASDVGHQLGLLSMRERAERVQGTLANARVARAAGPAAATEHLAGLLDLPLVSMEKAQRASAALRSRSDSHSAICAAKSTSASLRSTASGARKLVSMKLPRLSAMRT